ncbi:MAG: YraN family protein [Bacteroidales bacterium]|nr:YraN family protein [Bacteroidales bacterium]
MAGHNLLGEKGEKIAIQYLKDRSYKIRHTNWRYRKTEIDIIAEKNNLLVVVEVKTRTNDYFENPKDAVTIKKQKFIVSTTQAYIEEFNVDYEVRFDVIGISFENGQEKIEHIQDAFQPGLL